MAAASAQRQPFAEIGSSRLQSLSSAKNRQNAITDMLASCGKEKPFSSPVTSTKRPLAPSMFDDEGADAENVDPSLQAKRSKGVDGTPSKKSPLFSLSTDAKPNGFDYTSRLGAQTQHVSPPTSPLKRKSPAPLSPLAVPAAPSSAPAGRSPKHKRIGILSRKRVSMSPFKRFDPPAFGSKQSTSGGGLPFSIDAALSGTISSYTPPALSAPRPKVPTLEESMPKGWFFAIHEDTADEEAANLMEHSTCILDISSDDEAGPSSTRAKDERGKENIPPSDYPSAPSAGQASNKARRSVHVDAMADDGVERAPLGEMSAAEFYATGLNESSVEIVAPEGTVGVKVNASSVHEARHAGEIDGGQDENLSPVTPDSPTLLPLPSTDLLGHSLDAPGFVIAEDPSTP